MRLKTRRSQARFPYDIPIVRKIFYLLPDFLHEIKKRRSQATFPYDIPIIFPNVYIWSSLLRRKKFVFPAFEFRDFNNQCPDVYIKWGDIEKTYEFGRNLRSYLKKPPKVLYQALHPEEITNKKHELMVSNCQWNGM